MQLGALHLQGQPIAKLPATATTREQLVIAGAELWDGATLQDALVAAKQLTLGADKPGVYVMGGKRGYEIYVATVQAAVGKAPLPWHFEGNASVKPVHTLEVGQAFVDGDTVILR